MSSPSPFDKALTSVDEFSATLVALRERFRADGPSPPGMPQILTLLITQCSNVRENVSQGQVSTQANKEAMDRTIANLEDQVRDLERFEQPQRTQNQGVDLNPRIIADIKGNGGQSEMDQVLMDAYRGKQHAYNQAVLENDSLSQRVLSLERQLQESRITSETMQSKLAGQNGSSQSPYDKSIMFHSAEVQSLRDDIAEEAQAPAAARESVLEALRTSLAEKDRTIRQLQASLASSEDSLRQQYASRKSMQAEHLATISDINHDHHLEMDRLWKQVRQLRSHDDIPSATPATQMIGQDNRSTHVSYVRRDRTSTDAGTDDADSVDSGVIYVEGYYDGIEQAEEDTDTQRRSRSSEARSKRPLASGSESRVAKKPRELSSQDSGYTYGITDRSPSVASTQRAPHDADIHMDASNKVRSLWNMFVCAWDISTVEKNILLRQFDSIFIKGRDIESVIQRIESHVVGGFKSPAAYPRCCLLGDLRNHTHGKGGSMLAGSCPYCKSDGQNRLCVWASYVPGVQPTYGRRVGGVIPLGGARQYKRDATPWTVPVGATNARWVLHKRRTEAYEDIVNPWDVGGIRIAFDQDPLGE